MGKQHLLLVTLLALSFAVLSACTTNTQATTPATVPAVSTETAAAPTAVPQPASTDTVAAPTSTTAATAVSSTPTLAATGAPSATAMIAVQLHDNSIQLLSMDGKTTLLYKANDPVDISSIFPPGNVVGSALYLPISGVQSSVVRVDSSGAKTLDWIKGPVYGLAASPSQLAWGEANLNPPSPAQIRVSAPDGSGLKTALQILFNTTPRVLRVMRWSKFGTNLYFGKEPVGIGGYILFGGLTNIWSLDPASGKTTELVPEAPAQGFVCIDDLAPNEKLAADHCSNTKMKVTDIGTHVAKTINPPSNVTGVGVVGGARFSPDSSKLAYGLARRNPDDEQGWVALADASGGASTLIATSPAHDYFSVVGWLDPNTILLQTSLQTPGIWSVGTDGSNLKRLGDGVFLGIIQSGGVALGGACGEIHMLGPAGKPQEKSAVQSEACFFQAFQSCTPATLTVTMAGVDAGTIHQFAVEKSGGQCKLTDGVIPYVVPRPTPAPVSTVCTGLVQQNGGLLFQGCGDQGDISVPAA